MVTKAQPKTRADLIRERGEQIGWEAEQAARRQAEQAIVDEGRAAFQRTVLAARAAREGVRQRLEAQLPDEPMSERAFAERRAQIDQAVNEQLEATRPTLPSWEQLFEAKRAAELAAEADAKAARLAGISNHDRWTHSLDYVEREKVYRYEKLFGLPHPASPPE